MTDALPLSKIAVGRRRRADYGDLDELAASIAKYGLLHPVVIDEADRLVAGGRRLAAVQQLGWKNVEVRRLGELTDIELREIELEENLRRKDLTPYERSRNMVELAETAAQADVSSTDSPKVGRPQERGSLRQVADRVGVDKQTIANARVHVAAVERYPELASMTQSDALTIARNLDDLPDDKRSEARDGIAQNDADTLTTLAEKPPMPKNGKGPSPGVRWADSLHKISVLLNSVRMHGGIDRLAAEWDAEERQRFIARADQAIADLTSLREQMERTMTNVAA